MGTAMRNTKLQPSPFVAMHAIEGSGSLMLEPKEASPLAQRAVVLAGHARPCHAEKRHGRLHESMRAARRRC